MIGDFVGAVVRRVGDDDASLRRRVEIDVIEPDAVLADHATAPHALNEGATQLKVVGEHAIDLLAELGKLVIGRKTAIDDLRADSSQYGPLDVEVGECSTGDQNFQIPSNHRRHVRSRSSVEVIVSIAARRRRFSSSPWVRIWGDGVYVPRRTVGSDKTPRATRRRFSR